MDHAERPSTPVNDDTITLPRSVVERNKVDVTLTPHLQRTSAESVTPTNTPRRRAPRFDLPGQAMHPQAPTNCDRVVDDPFESEPNVHQGPNDNNATSSATNSGDMDDDFPHLVYPLPSGRFVEGLPKYTKHPFGYFVVTKGKKIG